MIGSQQSAEGHRWWPSLLTSLLCVLCVVYAGSLMAQPEEPPTLIARLSSSEQARQLSESKLWRLLLHYEEGLFGGHSRSDGDEFFLSEEQTPHAELLADIEALYRPSLKENEHFQCVFPARTTLILSALSSLALPPLPRASCPRRDAFLKDLDIHGLELMYASASFTQSASMFGHTLIHVLRGPEKDNLGDRVTSYVAYVTVGGPLEVIYGLTGQFPGLIEVANLAQQMLNYTVRERRNLWALKLNVGEEGLKRFAEHLWEMNSTFFRYHFFDENCAYYNQHLLQIALPDRDLKREMSIVSLPLESVHGLVREPGLVEQVTFYPSMFQSYRNGWATLSSKERSLVERLVQRPAPVSLPKERAALVYKTAFSVSMLDLYSKKVKVTDEDRATSDALLKLQASTGLDPQLVAPDHTSPLVGAGPHSLSLGGGALWGGAPFVDLELRPMLHERDDNPLSYERYNEITMLKAGARYLPSSNQLRLNQLTLGSVYNLREWTILGPLKSTPLSWAFDLGVRDGVRFNRGANDGYFELEWGVTLPVGPLGGLSLMAGPLGEWGLESDARAGLQGVAMLALYPHDRWTITARAGSRYFHWDKLSLEEREDWAEASINLFIGRSFTANLRGRATRVERARELSLALRYHWF